MALAYRVARVTQCLNRETGVIGGAAAPQLCIRFGTFPGSITWRRDPTSIYKPINVIPRFNNARYGHR